MISSFELARDIGIRFSIHYHASSKMTYLFKHILHLLHMLLQPYFNPRRIRHIDLTASSTYAGNNGDAAFCCKRKHTQQQITLKSWSP